MFVKYLASTFRFPIAMISCLALFACQTERPPEFGMVDWYIANGTGTDMSLNIVDKVCGRSHFRVRVPRLSETPITTCANSDGRAEIRYSRATGYSITANPIRHDVVSRNQSLHVE